MMNKIKNLVTGIKRAYDEGLVNKIRLATDMVCKLTCLVTLYCTCSSYDNGNVPVSVAFGIASGVLLIIDWAMVNPGIFLLIPYIITASWVVFSHHHNLVKSSNRIRRKYVLVYEECEGILDWLDELYYRWQNSEIVTKYKLY